MRKIILILLLPVSVSAFAFSEELVSPEGVTVSRPNATSIFWFK